MKAARRQSGLTLVEVLAALVLIAIVLVPALRALQTGVVGADVHADVAATHYRLQSRMESLLAEPYGSLEESALAAGGPTSPSSYSDTAGQPGRLLVYLGYYDADNADADDDPFTGTELDVLWIQVISEGTVLSLESLTTRGI